MSLDPRSIRTGLFVALVALGTYAVSLRAPTTIDAVSNVLLSYSLANDHDLFLDEFEGDFGTLSFYRFHVNGRSVPVFPPGAAAYAVPFVAVGGLFGIAPPQTASVTLVGRLAAASAAAASVLFVYLLAARITGRRWAIPVAALYAFGTATWPVSGGALWQHGPAQALLAGSQLALWPGRGSQVGIGRAGLTAGLATLVRIQDGAFAAAAGLYVLLRRRGGLRRYLATAALGPLILVGWDLAAYGSPISPQYAAFYRWGDVLVGTAGNLISPSRGLFVLSPFLVLAVYALVERARSHDDVAWWVRTQLVAVAAVLVVHGSSNDWWGGIGYGNRFMADALPFLAMGLALWVRRHARSGRSRLLLALMAIPAVAVSAVGALLYDRAGSWWALTDRHDLLMWRIDQPQWWYELTTSGARIDAYTVMSAALIVVMWSMLTRTFLRHGSSRRRADPTKAIS